MRLRNCRNNGGGEKNGTGHSFFGFTKARDSRGLIEMLRQEKLNRIPATLPTQSPRRAILKEGITSALPSLSWRVYRLLFQLGHP
jgi:hypothetical protein